MVVTIFRSNFPSPACGRGVRGEGERHAFCGRALAVAAIFFAGTSCAHSAPACPTPAYASRPAAQITDWYAGYLKPFRELAGIAEAPALTADQVNELIEKQDGFNRRSARDPLFFEALVQQIAQHYARAPDFRGLDTQTARRIYRPAAGAELDFSMLCVDTRTIVAPDDAFGITLFGVLSEECRRIGLKGLVFTDTLVNGAGNGQCRPDHVYYRMLVLPVDAGTNTITFICRKDVGGCFRQ